MRASAEVVDVAGQVSDLRWYWFLGKGGASTISGYFINRSGFKTGTSFTYNVPQGNGTNDPVSFATMYGAALPNDAVGFIGIIATADAYFDIHNDDAFDTDFETNYARYPAIAQGTMITIGRVA